MKIGVQTAGVLSACGIDGGFSLLRECGFDFVDFSCNILDGSLSYDLIRRGEQPLRGVFDLETEKLIELLAPYKEAAARHGVSFGQAHAPFPTWLPDNEAKSDYLRMAIEKCVAMCGYLECPYLIIHPAVANFERRTDDLNAEWQANMNLYKPLVPALRKYHVTACLENMFTVWRGKPQESVCADFYEACDYIDELNDYAGEKRFAFCLDTGHALLTGSDIYTAIMKLGDRLEALHIHDNNGLSDQHLAPYMGVLDWNRFVCGLRDTGYRGGLSFETYRTLSVFDRELMGEVLRLIASAGRLFARRIEEGE